MKTITLPDELPLSKTLPVQVVDYSSSQASDRQYITLTQNTFSFLLEGTKEVVFDNSSLSIDDSKFLLMKAGHCLMTEKLSPLSQYRSILLFFTNDVLLKIIRTFSLNKPVTAEHTSVNAFKYDAFIRRFVSSLLDITRLPKSAQEHLLSVKLEEILLYLSAIHGTGFLYALAANSNNSTQKFIRTVEANQLSRLSLKELSFLCGMSVSTFKREFEKHYSESPIKWFQHKRLEHARYLLDQEQKNASEIYFEAGYENLSSFIQAYKSKYGVTPKQHHKT